MADPELVRPRVHEAVSRHRRSDRGGAVPTLEALCRAVCEDLGVIAATVSLLPGVGAHPVCAASSSTARKLDEAQFSVGEGPARAAFDARRPVLVPDLERTGSLRWPGWAPAALTEGVVGVYSFPLHVGATIFGVLTLYAGADTAPLGQDEVLTGLVFAEVATEVLLDSTLPEAAAGGQLEPDLGATLDTHAYVYQAQGMVMVELGVSLAEALALMRAHAWATGRDLTSLAGEIVAGRFMPPRDTR
ncbi:GAF and ANTAR domain-containing protein [Nocardioides lianchengensis]|uniref:GAF domain-containing protein n=1 Tax=Nocardioides lianchengensis TaxID=1045774 RepID=A0A1G6YWM9_9ACTN|nr:GAF and ANTAR domain-containing protein [Nocardioides lianchengensis]NYG09512.1 hypothetical protein [Nocardioides lianchengensis]SDD94473.1 GAF domain-containing protein [Nocardioides lianchengensis]